jgi:hypothetical protein
MADTTPQVGIPQVTTDFPPALAKGILQVMAALGTLAKDHENKGQGGYNYASIDDFIDHVRGPCIEAEIFIIPNEAEPSRLIDVIDKNGKPVAMWWTRFAFTFVHVSGAAYGPIFKTVLVQALGAQSAGAAQSYAMKQLDRGIFQIKTGDDDDPDKEKTPIRSRGDEETDLQKQAGKIRRSMLSAQDLDELGLIWSDNSVTLDHIRLRSETAYDFLVSEYSRRKAQMEAV